MNDTTKRSRPLLIFYLLVAYVFIQFSWWTYSMFQLNNEIAHLKAEVNLLKGESPSEIITTGNELNAKLHRRWVMISSEGAVFCGLLLLGIVQVRRTFKKENQLANQQKNFLLSITHELKSPIASAKLQLQTLQKHELSKEQQQEIIANAINDTERLNNLVENILLAAKIDNHVITLQKEKIDLSEYLTKNMRETIQLFNYKNIVLDIDRGVSMSVDKINFPSIVLNLIENAVKYSPKNSAITLRLKKQDQKIILKVEDQGIGISDADKKTIFDKFFRVGNEETRKTKGTGLGLYIVKHLVEQHNGVIVVKNNSPKGSVFEIIFC